MGKKGCWGHARDTLDNPEICPKYAQDIFMIRQKYAKACMENVKMLTLQGF